MKRPDVTCVHSVPLCLRPSKNGWAESGSLLKQPIEFRVHVAQHISKPGIDNQVSQLIRIVRQVVQCLHRRDVPSQLS